MSKYFVGDWVQDKQGRIKQVDVSDLYDTNSLEPIPITEQFLTNILENYAKSCWRFRDVDEDDILFGTMHISNHNGFFVSISNYVDDIGFNGSIDFVHELQHILDLTKINFKFSYVI